MAPAGPRTVAVDASVLINFLHLDRLDLLAAFVGWRFVVPEEVVAEIQRDEQRARLEQAVELGHLAVEASSTDLDEIALALGLRAVMDKGEAACLAMATRRGWSVACDERGPFLREAQERIGLDRVIDTPGLLLRAIRKGHLSVPDADAMKAQLEAHRFKMRFTSFAELLRP